MKMQGKSVVVTGASSGMGDAIVRLFVAEGASVVAVARRKERLEALKESLAEAPGTIEIYPGDVSDQSICEGMIDFAVEKFGKLDALINNAGVMDDMSPIGDATNEKYEKSYGGQHVWSLLRDAKSSQRLLGARQWWFNR